MATLSELRALARKRQAAANRKVSRLKTQKGIHITGSDQDVRKPAQAIGRMNSNTLKKYINTLNGFVSRATSFVAGSEGAPLPKGQFNATLRRTMLHNERVAQFERSVSHIDLPGKGSNIGQRDARFRDGRGKIGTINDASLRPLNRLELDASRIENAKGLMKLDSRLNRIMGAQYVADELKRNRNEVELMLGQIGDPGMKALYDSLSDEQFHVWWAYGGIAEPFSLMYEQFKSANAGEKDKYRALDLESNDAEVYESLKWATGLDVKSLKE